MAHGRGSPDANVQVLAGRADDGRRAVLVSNFKSGADEVRLTLRGAESTTFGVTCLDKDNDDLRYDVTVPPDGTYTGKIVGNQRPGIWYRYQVEYDLDAKTYSFKVFEGGATMLKRGGAVGRLVGETDGMPFLGTLSADSGPISHVALYAHGLAGIQEQSGYFANISVDVPEGDGWRTVWSGTDDLGACDSFSMKSSW